MGEEGTYLNILKAKYDNPTANVALGEKLKGFPLRSGTQQGCPFAPLLSNTGLEGLGRTIRQDKENKSSKFGRRKRHCCYVLMISSFI